MLTISIGQALLILIEENKHTNPNYVKQLKKLYFLGFKTKADFIQLEKIKQDPLLHTYQLCKAPEVINEDASRRYFETHLCFATLKNKIKAFPLDLAKSHYESIRDAFGNLGGDLDPVEFKKSGQKKIVRDYETEKDNRKKIGLCPEDLIKGLSKIEQDTIDRLFSGHFIETDHETAKEYADLFTLINQNIDLSQEDKEKTNLLIKSWRLAMILLRKINKYQALGLYPIDNIPGASLYHKDIYLPENRGRKRKEECPGTHSSQAFGLIKSHMPLPLDDKALASAPFNYPKPAEMSTYIIEAEWNQYSTGLLVHPYSNAISGTMLLQLRILLKLNLEQNLCLDTGDKLQDYLTLMVAILTAHTGGHSLLEFTSPLLLNELKNYFSFMSGYEQITLDSMFRKNNEPAFEAALNKTIVYHTQILKRAELLTELKLKTPLIRPLPLYQYEYQADMRLKRANQTLFNAPTSITHGLASLKG